MTNEFKTPSMVTKPPVIITDKEKAIYNYVKLKMDYETKTVDEISQNILKSKYARHDKMLYRVGQCIIVCVAVFVVGIIIHRFF